MHTKNVSIKRQTGAFEKIDTHINIMLFDNLGIKQLVATLLSIADKNHKIFQLNTLTLSSKRYY